MEWGILTFGKNSANVRMYFLTYESLIKRDTSRGMKREDIQEWKLCLYGALYVPSSVFSHFFRSGEAMWLSSYPLGDSVRLDALMSRCNQIADANRWIWRWTKVC